MEQAVSKALEFMSDPTVEEARRLVRLVAGPRVDGDCRDSLIARAARRLGWTARRVKTVWYGEGRLRAAEMDVLRDAVRASDAEATRVLIDLRTAIERAERILAAAED